MYNLLYKMWKQHYKKEKRQSINTYAHEYQQKSLIKINTPKYTHLPKPHKKQLQYRLTPEDCQSQLCQTQLCQTQLCQDCQSHYKPRYILLKTPSLRNFEEERSNNGLVQHDTTNESPRLQQETMN